MSATVALAQTPKYPWGPEVRCNLNPAKPEGLHSDAYGALKSIAMAHRITQGKNDSADRGNVHYTDGTINGKGYTGAADLSVRCLTDVQIKTLLDRLADIGFAAWYRQDGKDDWSGPPHIHAVWAGCSLKPILRRQVESWLSGRTGLPGDRVYQFWQTPTGGKTMVRTLYHKFN
jgi:hypothetical protein